MTTIPPIAKNFPDSTAVPSSYFRWPGIADSSTQTVRRILEENDRKYDIYEKARFAHNHFPHSALTRYALGASPKLLNDTWAHDEPHLAPLDPEGRDETGDLSRLPESITRENWDDPSTLGFKDAYSRYLVFFHAEIERLGPLVALEDYIFSPEANWVARHDRPPPQMLVRMVAGVLHPFIHIGFGLEFKDIVVLAEGLAELAVHDHGIMRQLFPSSWPQEELSLQPGTASAGKTDVWGDAYPDTSPAPRSGLYWVSNTHRLLISSPFKGSQNIGFTLPYLVAHRLKQPLKLHPLLECKTWDPKPYGQYVSWNVVEFPAMAHIYVDYDDSPTELIKERFQPATYPKVEELHLLHSDTGWSIRIANRLGVNLTDVLTGIFDFFASPLYVDELGEMHPRAVRIMEQQYFERRDHGLYDTFQGYRKSDALLNKTYFDGIRWDPEEVQQRLNFTSTNVFVLRLNNC